MPDHADATNQTDLLPLDPRLQYIFESEVLQQWAFTFRSVMMMNDALQRADLAAFWFAMDATLGALANISKIFFPPSTRSQAKRRGRRLREAFGVQDNSVLKERALRDAFEHFDERIDRWFQHNRDRAFADRNVAPAGAIAVGLGPADFMRHFDPRANVVSVLGDSLEAPIPSAQEPALGGRRRPRSAMRSPCPPRRENVFSALETVATAANRCLKRAGRPVRGPAAIGPHLL